MFFYFCKVLFSDFLQFNGNFVDAQNNSEYRDWAPLKGHYHDVAHARTRSVFFHQKTIELSL